MYIKASSILISITLIVVSSCSGISSKRSLFGGEDAAKNVSGDTVPKEQYQDLLKKYDRLMKEKKMSMIKNQQELEVSKDKDPFDLSATAAENSNMEKEQLVEDVVNQLVKIDNNKNLNATVNAFEKKELSSKPAPILPAKEYNGAVVESHMAKIRKADMLQAQNKFDAALALIKEVEKSPVRQIQVRAKYLLGEILFKQGEFDLAMQVYEEVITKYAFSGLVIKTLGRLIVCSEKLKQSQKQEKYYSMLHDFFEEGA